MTETEIELPNGESSQQFGVNNVYIDKFLPLALGINSASGDKIKSIFEVLKTQENISQSHLEVILHMIDACRCTTYKHTTVKLRNWVKRIEVKTSNTIH